MHRTLCLDSVSDVQLVERLRARLADHRRLEAEVIAHLAEVDKRRLYLGRAMPSMHAFCVQVLHMSDDRAYRRIAVARASRRHPVLLSMLADGRLHVTGISRLAPHLSDDNNVDSVLKQAEHRTTRQIEELIAELSPAPDGPARVRRLPIRKGPSRKLVAKRVLSDVPESCDAPSAHGGSAGSEIDSVSSVVGARSSGVGHRESALLQPIAPARYKVQFTASQELQGKLRRAQALFRHKEHGGDLAEVIDEAMTLLLSKLEARRQGGAKKPRKTPEDSDTSGKTRRIPAAIKREIYERDAGRCAYVDEDGNRCPCDDPGQIEVHHVVPYGRGGDHRVENLELRCRGHNRYQAELDYGTQVMARYRKGAGRAREVAVVDGGERGAWRLSSRGAACSR